MSYSKNMVTCGMSYPIQKSVLVAGKVWEVSDTNSDFEDNLYVLGIDYWYDLWNFEGE